MFSKTKPAGKEEEEEEEEARMLSFRCSTNMLQTTKPFICQTCLRTRRLLRWKKGELRQGRTTIGVTSFKKQHDLFSPAFNISHHKNVLTALKSIVEGVLCFNAKRTRYKKTVGPLNLHTVATNELNRCCLTGGIMLTISQEG